MQYINRFKEAQSDAQPQKRSTKKMTTEGLTMSLSALELKIKSGIPPAASARQVESYYRNQDLTDVESVAKKYRELEDKLVQHRTAVQNKLAEKRRIQTEAMERFIAWEQAQNNEASKSQP